MPVGAVAGPNIGACGYGRPNGKCENGTEELWEVRPFHDYLAAPIICRRTDLRMIPASWMEEARNSSYDFRGITGDFQGPCLLEFMAKRLQQMLAQRTRKGLGELWHFQSSLSQWKAGVVYADGDKATQLLPRSAMVNFRGESLGRQQWWPVKSSTRRCILSGSMLVKEASMVHRRQQSCMLQSRDATTAGSNMHSPFSVYPTICISTISTLSQSCGFHYGDH